MSDRPSKRSRYGGERFGGEDGSDRRRGGGGGRDYDRRRDDGDRQHRRYRSRSRSRSRSRDRYDRRNRDRDSDRWRDDDHDRGSGRERGQNRDRDSGRDRDGAAKRSQGREPDHRERTRHSEHGRQRSASPRRSNSPAQRGRATDQDSQLPSRPKGEKAGTPSAPLSFKMGSGRDREHGEGQDRERPDDEVDRNSDVASKRPEPMNEDDEDEDLVVEDDSMASMQAMMGFGGFGTTHGKKVSGNNVGAMRKEKKTEYRQYMNRTGGFNRPLSPSR